MNLNNNITRICYFVNKGEVIRKVKVIDDKSYLQLFHEFLFDKLTNDDLKFYSVRCL